MTAPAGKATVNVNVNWKKTVQIVEVTALTAVASFLASISQLAGPSFDGKHIAAAGIGALTAFSYKMAGVLNTLTSSPGAASSPPQPEAPAPVVVAVVPPVVTPPV